MTLDKLLVHSDMIYGHLLYSSPAEMLALNHHKQCTQYRAKTWLGLQSQPNGLNLACKLKENHTISYSPQSWFTVFATNCSRFSQTCIENTAKSPKPTWYGGGGPRGRPSVPPSPPAMLARSSSSAASLFCLLIHSQALPMTTRLHCTVERCKVARQQSRLRSVCDGSIFIWILVRVSMI